ncbi:hypothetical protein K8T06_02935 [bacterium]|nr:hypothetical protein [bacterium]
MNLSNFDIVLVEPVYPGNVGAIARSASNYGVNTIKIIGDLDYLCLDAKKMALYGFPLLEKASRYKCLSDALADCHLVIGTVHQDRFNRSVPLPIWEVIATNRDTLVTGRTAIIFGREDNGLTREEIDMCHALAIIPTPENMSFNLAHSVTVFLYEVYRLVHDQEHSPISAKPTQNQSEDLINLLHKTLHSVGFFRGDHELSTMTLIRELSYRLNIAASDIPMIKAVLFKIYGFAERAIPYMPEKTVRDCSLRSLQQDIAAQKEPNA